MNKDELANRFYEISCESFSTGSPWKKEQFLSFLTETNNHFLVIERNEEIAGFVLLSSVLDEAELLLIAVTKDYQRQGLGEELLKQASIFLKSQQILSLFIEVRESNLAAQKLYQKLGCEQIAKRKSYYQHPKEDALIWQLLL